MTNLDSKKIKVDNELKEEAVKEITNIDRLTLWLLWGIISALLIVSSLFWFFLKNQFAIYFNLVTLLILIALIILILRLKSKLIYFLFSIFSFSLIPFLLLFFADFWAKISNLKNNNINLTKQLIDKDIKIKELNERFITMSKNYEKLKDENFQLKTKCSILETQLENKNNILNKIKNLFK